MIEIQFDLFEIIQFAIDIEGYKEYYRSELVNKEITMDEIIFEMIREYIVFSIEDMIKPDCNWLNMPCNWVTIYQPDRGILQVFDAKIRMIFLPKIDKVMYRGINPAYTTKVKILE